MDTMVRPSELNLRQDGSFCAATSDWGQKKQLIDRLGFFWSEYSTLFQADMLFCSVKPPNFSEVQVVLSWLTCFSLNLDVHLADLEFSQWAVTPCFSYEANDRASVSWIKGAVLWELSVQSSLWEDVIWQCVSKREHSTQIQSECAASAALVVSPLWKRGWLSQRKSHGWN